MNIHEYQAKQLLAKYGVAIVRGGVAYTAPEAENVAKDLGGPIMEPAFTKAEVIEPRRLEITYDRDRTSAGQVLALVQSHGYAIEDVTTREADLEDVFVQLTGAG